MRVTSDVMTEPLVALDPAWPKMSMADATAVLTAPGARFEMETVTIRGVPTRVWKNAPNDLGVLLDLSRTHGARLFTILDDDRISFEANWRATAALAQALQDMGVGKGDRVAFAMRNLPEWPMVFFAITTIGAIAVPLNAWWTGAELAYGIRDSGAKVVIVDGERLERLRDHREELGGVSRWIVARGGAEGDTTAIEDIVGAPASWAALPDIARPVVAIDPDDEATIFYTSGTTGNPKGALGTHRNLMSNILSGGFSAARSFLRRGEAIPDPQPRTTLTVIPMFHVTACSASLMGSMAAGNTTIFMRKWDAVQAMEIIEREKVNVTGGVPTIAWQLIEHPDRANYDLSSIEAIAYGGAPSAPELVKRIYEEFGALPGNGWGMTETMATVTSHSSEDYLDLARLDDEGFVYIVDRAKDMVLRGGENIYSSEVENALYEHPAVTDCAIIGIPHRTLGEEPAAVVHLAPGMSASEGELQDWVRARLAAFKVPVAVHFVADTLPRNANGKILKKDLGAFFA